MQDKDAQKERALISFENEIVHFFILIEALLVTAGTVLTMKDFFGDGVMVSPKIFQRSVQPHDNVYPGWWDFVLKLMDSPHNYHSVGNIFSMHNPYYGLSIEWYGAGEKEISYIMAQEVLPDGLPERTKSLLEKHNGILEIDSFRKALGQLQTEAVSFVYGILQKKYHSDDMDEAVKMGVNNAAALAKQSYYTNRQNKLYSNIISQLALLNWTVSEELYATRKFIKSKRIEGIRGKLVNTTNVILEKRKGN